jgi:hypothetical protein
MHGNTTRNYKHVVCACRASQTLNFGMESLGGPSHMRQACDTERHCSGKRPLHEAILLGSFVGIALAEMKDGYMSNVSSAHQHAAVSS